MTGKLGISRSRLYTLLSDKRGLTDDDIDALIYECLRQKDIVSKAAHYVKRNSIHLKGSTQKLAQQRLLDILEGRDLRSVQR